MMGFSNAIKAAILNIILLTGLASAHASPAHQDQISRLNYYLAIDRLDFYAAGLADHLMDHEQKNLAEAIRKLTPEDFQKHNFSLFDLNQPDRWNELILQTLKYQDSQFKNTQLKELEWNYNFFRKKLMEGFKADLITLKSDSSLGSIIEDPPKFTLRSVPKGDGSKILLDAERYIAEKTTRAVFWDAASNQKSIEFHLGTERDFRQRISQESRQVIAEIKTRAANYNKIYLVFDPKSNHYSYAFTRISGNDRISHLIAQLKILSFSKSKTSPNEFVRVYGNANQVHRDQETRLLNLFNTLPKADLVVIGQKSAIANVIALAGNMAQVQPDISKAVGEEKSALQKLSQRIVEQSSYFAATTKSSVVKMEFDKVVNPLVSNYEIFTSEQPSHDISDVLLETRDGRVVRWRFISNMWGDEVVPVARAIKNSGHEKVVYIGTAGALIDKGLKVGDVVAPSRTYNQEGRLLNLDSPQYGDDFVKKGLTLGQVRSPFQESQKWFHQWKNSIDLVELETGYLRENLGPRVNFQPFLLVSDIVGSEHESLAVAAADSGKRKNGQLRLIESLFLKNNIKKPIGNVEMISAEVATRQMYHKISELRPSRDSTSKLQLAQIAIRKGLKTPEELEGLIKSEPTFDRQFLFEKLEKYSGALDLLSSKYNKMTFHMVGGEDFLSGIWNPKRVLKIQIMIPNVKSDEAARLFSREIEKIDKVFGKELLIEFVNFDSARLGTSLTFSSRQKKILVKYYDDNVFKKMGFNREVDRNGGVRFREIIETSGGMRCEALFLK